MHHDDRLWVLADPCWEDSVGFDQVVHLRRGTVEGWKLGLCLAGETRAGYL
jgi:hypothetical protein